MRRAAVLCGFLVALLGWSSLVNAHEDQAFHPGGTTFCVDPGSVQVALELPDRTRTAAAKKILLRDLAQMPRATLERSGVAFEVNERCAGARDYTLLVAEIRYLDPKLYVGFGQQAHTYTLFLQVGGYVKAPLVAFTQQLPANRYNAWLSEIYAEGDTGRPFEPFVVGEGRKLAQGLTAYWWEDNPRRPLRAALLPPLLGSTLALVSGLSVWWLLRRYRNAGQDDAYSLSG